jgi:dynein heavy chain
MRRPIPYIAMEIQAQREKYRVLIEKILHVVREYNKIIGALDKDDRKLFTGALFQ